MFGLFRLSCLLCNHIILHTLLTRNAAFVPPSFAPLLEKVYNNPAAHHHKASPLSQGRLNKLCKSLYVVLAFPVMETAKWRECATATQQLALPGHLLQVSAQSTGTATIQAPFSGSLALSFRWKIIPYFLHCSCSG